MRMQTTIADPGTAPAIAGKRHIAHDLDYLAARLHARRSRMAEAERLDSLCRTHSLTELFHTIFPESEFKGVPDFQRRLLYELIDELSGLNAHMSGPDAGLIDRTLVRFQVENLKLLLRGCLTSAPMEEMYEHLAPLPAELALDNEGLATAASPEDFVRLVPKGLLRENLERALEIYRDNPGPFFFETALDRGYFQGLIAAMEKLSQEDRETVGPMIYQEMDIFHLMLVARGKFYYNLMPEVLRPLHVTGARVPRALFAAMLNDPDLSVSAGRVGQRVLDAGSFEEGLKGGPMTIDASVLESLAWKRFFRLANLAFRQSHMGLGTIIGYAGLRRMEVANLITISEGINSGVTAEIIRGRLIPRTNVGVHV
jgi:vacuolar-type H+-ATPase subunit C/Vma6